MYIAMKWVKTSMSSCSTNCICPPPKGHTMTTINFLPFICTSPWAVILVEQDDIHFFSILYSMNDVRSHTMTIPHYGKVWSRSVNSSIICIVHNIQYLDSDLLLCSVASVEQLCPGERSRRYKEDAIWLLGGHGNLWTLPFTTLSLS